MVEQSPNEEILGIFEEIEQNPKVTQRHLSDKLGISLGKTNYVLNELIRKGLVKVKNFSTNPNKIKRLSYFVTKKGLQQKIRLLFMFLKIKEVEYYRIKQKWEKVNS